MSDESAVDVDPGPAERTADDAGAAPAQPAPEPVPASLPARLATAYLDWLPWVAVVLGVALRLREWLHDRSLWLDEIHVAQNIADRNFVELTRPLAADQAAPVGWLWFERVSVNLFGVNEMALRLGPFLFSVAAVIVFPLAARQWVGRAATPVAALLFATSPALIYYAAETKQYSSDVTCVLLALLVTTPLIRSRPTVGRVVLWALAGSALSWFSFPALAVAGLCGLALVVRWIRDLPALALVVGGGVLVGASVLGENAVTLSRLSENDSLTRFWQAVGGYPPTGAGLGQDLSWLRTAGLAVMRDPGHFTAPAVGLLVAALGLADVARTRPETAALLGLPLVAGVGLAVTRHYPMSMRLAVYLIPSLVLLLAAGATAIVTFAGRQRPSVLLAGAAAVGAAALLVVVAARPVATGIGKFGRPDDVESGREALAYVGHHQLPGDVVLIAWPWGNANYSFYGKRYGVHRDGGFALRERGCGPDPVGRLPRWGRVWLVFAHRASNEPPDRAEIVVSQFETRATLLRAYRGAGGAAAFLLDFARPPTDPPTPRPLWQPDSCIGLTS